MQQSKKLRQYIKKSSYKNDQTFKQNHFQGVFQNKTHNQPLITKEKGGNRNKLYFFKKNITKKTPHLKNQKKQPTSPITQSSYI